MRFIKHPVAAVCAGLFVTCLHAQDAAVDIDIPAQPLQRVLDALAAQTEIGRAHV